MAHYKEMQGNFPKPGTGNLAPSEQGSLLAVSGPVPTAQEFSPVAS